HQDCHVSSSLVHHHEDTRDLSGCSNPSLYHHQRTTETVTDPHPTSPRELQRLSRVLTHSSHENTRDCHGSPLLLVHHQENTMGLSGPPHLHENTRDCHGSSPIPFTSRELRDCQVLTFIPENTRGLSRRTPETVTGPHPFSPREGTVTGPNPYIPRTPEKLSQNTRDFTGPPPIPFTSPETLETVTVLTPSSEHQRTVTGPHPYTQEHQRLSGSFAPILYIITITPVDCHDFSPIPTTTPETVTGPPLHPENSRDCHGSSPPSSRHQGLSRVLTLHPHENTRDCHRSSPLHPTRTQRLTPETVTGPHPSSHENTRDYHGSSAPSSSSTDNTNGLSRVSALHPTRTPKTLKGPNPFIPTNTRDCHGSSSSSLYITETPGTVRGLTPSFNRTPETVTGFSPFIPDNTRDCGSSPLHPHENSRDCHGPHPFIQREHQRTVTGPHPSHPHENTRDYTGPPTLLVYHHDNTMDCHGSSALHPHREHQRLSRVLTLHPHETPETRDCHGSSSPLLVHHHDNTSGLSRVSPSSHENTRDCHGSSTATSPRELQRLSRVLFIQRKHQRLSLVLTPLIPRKPERTSRSSSPPWTVGSSSLLLVHITTRTPETVTGPHLQPKAPETVTGPQPFIPQEHQRLSVLPSPDKDCNASSPFFTTGTPETVTGLLPSLFIYTEHQRLSRVLTLHPHRTTKSVTCSPPPLTSPREHRDCHGYSSPSLFMPENSKDWTVTGPHPSSLYITTEHQGCHGSSPFSPKAPKTVGSSTLHPDENTRDCRVLNPSSPREH
ncbi:proteoglycan 4-like, partial [Homarus americanus]|uniref:proteoglycan 4-like n=1 Tax=Homarus americanus TaxID=6706 RepID=UPI001C43DCF1